MAFIYYSILLNAVPGGALSESGLPWLYFAFGLFAGLLLLAATLIVYVRKNKLAESRQAELEARVKQQADELSGVLERLADGFLMLDKDFRYTYANKRIGEMTGRDPQALIGKNIWDEFPDALQSATYHAFNKAMTEKTFVRNVDYHAPLQLWQENYIYPSDEGISVFIRDITAQKKAELQLARSENIYRTIASSIPGSSIFLFDRDEKYLLVEGDLLQSLGYDKETITGRQIAEVLPPESRRRIGSCIARAFKGEMVTIESSMAGFEILTRFVPLRNEEEEVYAVMAAGIDISELKRAQEQVQEINQALERKVAERTLELESVNNDLEAFTYSVAHDLRTPLRAMSGYSSIVMEDYGPLLDEEGKRLLGQIGRHAKKMGVLIENLLTFSKLGRKEMQMGDVDMDTLVESCLADLHLAYPVMPAVSVGPLHPVTGDQWLLRHVLTNLLSNAIKYSAKKPGAAVSVSSEKQLGQVVYTVRDNGVGFDAGFSHKLFGVFQRLHTDEEYEGTGVGLAIVQRIIERHGGRVWAESTLGEGAAFHFSIPDPGSASPNINPNRNDLRNRNTAG